MSMIIKQGPPHSFLRGLGIVMVCLPLLQGCPGEATDQGADVSNLIPAQHLSAIPILPGSATTPATTFVELPRADYGTSAYDQLYGAYATDAALFRVIEDPTSWKGLFDHFALRAPNVDFDQYRAVVVIDTPDTANNRPATFLNLYDQGSQFVAQIVVVDNSGALRRPDALYPPSLGYGLVPRAKPTVIEVSTIGWVID